ncbi:SPFH domain-containing protein [Hydrogenivirga caldilitoris]|uniref:Protein QmcA n=1 Tax=Hydrogenivirga caldilitoris TaxID=246264 RepID=A0A497XQ92_9AQUI|nr:slipin family protein [Hydrogenivirga caldilitoris]RLJ71156.1 SPFH domain-containing protein [Hydrogenivirga caldilitoris]
MRGLIEALPFFIFVAVFLAIAMGGNIFKYIGGFAMIFSPIVVLVILVIIFLLAAIKIIPEYERAVVFRLGRVIGAKGPGLIIIIPIIDRIVRVSLRTITLDVPTQDIITKDNVSVQVDAVVYFRVVDPIKAIIEVEDYLYATSQIAQTTLRSVCGEAELDELLAQREQINLRLQEIIDRQTDPWGVKVTAVELKKIDLPEDLRKAIARQAEAERERRAKIISAEAEFQAAQKLLDAAKILATEPIAIQLRYLETLHTIGLQNTKTVIFPFPFEFVEFIGKKREGKDTSSPQP